MGEILLDLYNDICSELGLAPETDETGMNAEAGDLTAFYHDTGVVTLRNPKRVVRIRDAVDKYLIRYQVTEDTLEHDFAVVERASPRDGLHDRVYAWMQKQMKDYVPAAPADSTEKGDTFLNFRDYTESIEEVKDLAVRLFS